MAGAVIALAGCGASAGTTAASSTTTSSTATDSTSPTAVAAAAAGSGSFKAACPSTAEIASALGQQYPAPKKSASGQDLTCDYSSPAGDILVIVFGAAPGTTGADLKLAMDAQAKGQNVPDHAVPGLGDAAYEFVMSGTANLDMLSGSEDIAMTSTASLAHLETLAHDVLGS
jgi:hypothetical protein